jgi:tRNA (cmo5U34)-methyltransferase
LYLSELKNERIAKGFDWLAPVYSCLSGIVFGKAIGRSQNYFLNFISANDRVLILGGGSGELLKSLLKQQPNVAVDYIDISEKMIQLARKKTQSSSNVNFIIGTEQNIPNREYTVVITNFYLDLFSDAILKTVVEKIKIKLQPDAYWLVTDFVNKKWWHQMMLGVMYLFFRITTHIEATRLPHWTQHLMNHGATEIDSKRFYGGFIESKVYALKA